MSTTGKTPISLLNEMLVRKRLLPMYNLLMSGVGTNQGQFIYEVTAGDFVKARGRGRSKKEAKQDAAKVALEMLKYGLAAGTVSLDTSQDDDSLRMPSLDVISPYHEQLRENAVGSLNELCASTEMPMPEYQVIREDGPPHAKLFELACRVSSFEHCAVGRTKQQAKQMAAKLMLDTLEKLKLLEIDKLPVIPPARDDETPEERERMMAEIHAARAVRGLGSAPKRSLLGQQMGCGLKHDWTEETLELIKEFREPTTSFLTQLQRMCQVLDLQLSFSMVDSTDNDVTLEVLSMSTQPENCFMGRGADRDEARNKAAQRALKFIDIMVCH